MRALVLLLGLSLTCCSGTDEDVLLRRADLAGPLSDGSAGPEDGDAGCFWLTWYAFDMCLSPAQCADLAAKQCAAITGARLAGYEVLDPCAQGYRRVRSRCCPAQAPSG